MPEVYFHIEWPDGDRTRCYSPSTIVYRYFCVGQTLTIDELIATGTKALRHAGDRVETVYGYRCTSAEQQLTEILARARNFTGAQELSIVEMTSRDEEKEPDEL